MYSSETLTDGGRAAGQPRGAPHDEQRLARMAARGERQAFEAVFERYNGEVYRYCRALLGEPDEAQDALQNTMALALRHLPRLTERVSLRGWLYRVAHNESVSIMRRRPVPIDPALLPDVAGPSAQVELERRERLRRLVADLHQLPDRHRGALVMRELSGLSYAEIAVAIETSEAAARQVVYEARESMRSFEFGREMDCAAVRRAISERDGRRLRGRQVRAHLRACASCADFLGAISIRRTDLAALYLPLAPASASATLSAILGGAGHGGASGLAAAGGTGGTAAGALGGGSALTGAGVTAVGGTGLKVASIVSAVAIGAGAAGIGGGMKLPFGASHPDGSNPTAGASVEAEHGHGAHARTVVHRQRTAPAHGRSPLSTRGGGRSGEDPGRPSERATPPGAKARSANPTPPASRGRSSAHTGNYGPPPGIPPATSSAQAPPGHEPGARGGAPGAAPMPDHAASTRAQTPAEAAIPSTPRILPPATSAGKQAPDNPPPAASTR